MIEKTEYPFWIALGGLKGISTHRKNEFVIKCCHELGRQLSDLFRASDKDLTCEYALKDSEAAAIKEAMANISKYSCMAEDLLEQGYGILPLFDNDYPASIKKHLGINSPSVLYYKGDKSILKEESVAIVGSRKASGISLQFTDNIAKLAVAKKQPTVSGYAAGVDRQALESSIKYGGKSIVVLPQGILTFSSGFKALYREIIAGKVIVTSSFYPSAPWSKELAMARNPIIYAFAQNIFVAESSSKGGTFSGVENGLRKGRTIYIRYPETAEDNANMLLISMGCKPVNMQGDTLAVLEDPWRPHSQEKDIEEKIIKLLQSSELTSNEIVSILGIDWSPQKVSRFASKIQGIKKTIKKSKSYYTLSQDVQDTLF